MGSDYSFCPLGTDLTDCGFRSHSALTGFPAEGGTSYLIVVDGYSASTAGDYSLLISKEFNDNTCVYPDDGFCDDGGSDSDTSVCDLGTDLADCGPRSEEDVDSGGTGSSGSTGD